MPHFRSTRDGLLVGLLAAICLWCCAVLVSLGTALGQAQAEAEPGLAEGHYAPVRPRIPINTTTRDGEAVRGQVTSFTTTDLHITEDGRLRVVPWSAFEADYVEHFGARLIPSRDAEMWYVLLAILSSLEDGREPALRTLRRLERMDPGGTDRQAAARRSIPGGDDAEGEEQDAHAWPELSDDEQSAITAELEEEVAGYLDRLEMEMRVEQTDRFLVFTDLAEDEADFWIGLLDRMYNRLCGVFDLDRRENIWRGKCVLILFNSQTDYLRYNARVYGNNVQGSAGVCYQLRDGAVHIFMYRSNNRDQLAHTLVHEATHGFLFRYQSSHNVPNWLNEGLAEYVAETLLDNGGSERRINQSRWYVRQRGRLDNFLSARNISGIHYGLAYDVTKMMVDENRRGYVRMIRALKEGHTADEAFDDHYGKSIAEVFAYYARTRLEMQDLRLD